MQSLEAKIRKQQSVLICSGLGMILFGIWSIIRFLLMKYIDASWFEELLGTFDELPQADYQKIVVMIVLVILLLDLAIRLYVGLSAIREGSGFYRKHVTYIVIAFLYALFNIWADMSQMGTFFSEDIPFGIVTNVITDLTIQIATVEIIVSAIRVRYFEKMNSND